MAAEPSPETSKEDTPKAKSPFQRNLDVFISRIDSLKDHGTQAVVVINQASKQAHDELEAFLRSDATAVEGEEGAYNITEDKLTMFRRLERRRRRSALALRSVPCALTVALVSEFDAFMGATLKTYYGLKPDALQATQRTLTYADLVGFGSIDAAREHVLEKEVETLLRSSHSAQFDTLESKVGILLRKDLAIWKDFIELTERRNLFVHNDGRASSHYLQACEAAGYDCSGIKKGSALVVSQKYFTKAHETLYELAAKLSHVLWRKLAPDDRERADAHFAGTLIYDLLVEDRYRLARTLADFGAATFKKWGSDFYRRALIVNRAQAYIWDNRREEGLRILSAEDWSAASDDFQVCLAALRGEFAEAIRRMIVLGRTAGPKADGFRSWPVFRELRKEHAFQEAFSEVFGEPFSKVSIEPEDKDCGGPEAGLDSGARTERSQTESEPKLAGDEPVH